jgi:TolB-like protein
MLHRLLSAALGVASFLPAPVAAQGSVTRILVMPFDNPAHEPRLHWIAEAASLLVADELNARGVPAIRRAERLDAFEELHLPAAATLSRATVIKVGQLVGASEVISGMVRLSGEELIVEAHSVRIDIGRVQPPVSERGPLKDVVVLFERLSTKLASGAQVRGGGFPRPPL